MKIHEIDKQLEEEAKDEIDVEFEASDDDDDTEASLNQALTFMQDSLMLFDDLVDDTAVGRNKISAQMVAKIHKLCSEMWVFLQPFEAEEVQDEVRDDDVISVTDGDEGEL